MLADFAEFFKAFLAEECYFAMFSKIVPANVLRGCELGKHGGLRIWGACESGTPPCHSTSRELLLIAVCKNVKYFYFFTNSKKLWQPPLLRKHAKAS
jgi:hypothetical protein